jgi:UDPglucose 6-dehydrogenase
MNVVVVGAGYVGLVTAVCLAELGNTVTCVETVSRKVEMLRRGETPIFEEGLEPLLKSTLENGRIRFTVDLHEAMRGADIAFVCVGTPPNPVDGHADLSQVFAAMNQIREAATKPVTIVMKSTVPVGTGDDLMRAMNGKRNAGNLSIVSNPEFLREGSAIKDFHAPDRIVIGTHDEIAADKLKRLYQPLIDRGVPLIITDRRTSELIKYASNCFLAIKIAYINELANLCEQMGAEVGDLSRGLGLDSRIGNKFLQPGPGFGGSCFPKDMLALVKTAQDFGVGARLVETALASNDLRKGEMFRKIVVAAGGSVSGKRIAVLGLTFKANTDDIRASVSLVIVPQLVRAGAEVTVFDPEGMENASDILHDVTFASTLSDALVDADLAVILTEWPQFKALEGDEPVKAMRNRVVVDLRSILDPARMAALETRYHTIGRADRS